MFEELNILQPFFDEPTREFGVREIARRLRIAPATASKKLQHFKKDSILTSKKERLLVLYKANLDSEAYKDLKTFTTIQLLKKSGIIEDLNKYYLKPTIILFGSASKGLDTKTSDIDLAIISERKDTPAHMEAYEKKIKRTIELFPITALKNIKNEHLANSILNGITLQGEVQWTYTNT